MKQLFLFSFSVLLCSCRSNFEATHNPLGDFTTAVTSRDFPEGFMVDTKVPDIFPDMDLLSLSEYDILEPGKFSYLDLLRKDDVILVYASSRPEEKHNIKYLRSPSHKWFKGDFIIIRSFVAHEKIDGRWITHPLDVYINEDRDKLTTVCWVPKADNVIFQDVALAIDTTNPVKFIEYYCLPLQFRRQARSGL